MLKKVWNTKNHKTSTEIHTLYVFIKARDEIGLKHWPQIEVHRPIILLYWIFIFTIPELTLLLYLFAQPITICVPLPVACYIRSLSRISSIRVHLVKTEVWAMQKLTIPELCSIFVPQIVIVLLLPFTFDIISLSRITNLWQTPHTWKPNLIRLHFYQTWILFYFLGYVLYHQLQFVYPFRLLLYSILKSNYMYMLKSPVRWDYRSTEL